MVKIFIIKTAHRTLFYISIMSLSLSLSGSLSLSHTHMILNQNSVKYHREEVSYTSSFHNLLLICSHCSLFSSSGETKNFFINLVKVFMTTLCLTYNVT